MSKIVTKSTFNSVKKAIRAGSSKKDVVEILTAEPYLMTKADSARVYGQAVEAIHRKNLMDAVADKKKTLTRYSVSKSGNCQISLTHELKKFTVK
jgi:hypothetical protein